jgi:hypothetical protein
MLVVELPVTVTRRCANRGLRWRGNANDVPSLQSGLFITISRPGVQILRARLNFFAHTLRVNPPTTTPKMNIQWNLANHQIRFSRSALSASPKNSL